MDLLQNIRMPHPKYGWRHSYCTLAIKHVILTGALNKEEAFDHFIRMRRAQYMASEIHISI